MKRAALRVSASMLGSGVLAGSTKRGMGPGEAAGAGDPFGADGGAAGAAAPALCPIGGEGGATGFAATGAAGGAFALLGLFAARLFRGFLALSTVAGASSRARAGARSFGASAAPRAGLGAPMRAAWSMDMALP